jgi:predicted phosphodiesterase
MKFAVISDTHLGDPESTLVVMDKNGQPSDGKNMAELLKTLGQDNDYLILLGDIMDFAIDDYGDVYNLGAHFFTRIKESKVARRIVYIPGNHDYNIWDTIESQANVINQISSGQKVRKFRMSVPLLIDDRKPLSAIDTIKLAGVKRRDDGEPYGGMFLDDLIPNNKPTDPGYVPFIVAFPNIYLFTDKETVILTHGQYLESYWALTSEIFRIIKKITAPLSMKDFVAINFPLCQLGSTGVGQAGPLTNTVLEIEKDVSSGKCVLLKQYIKRLLPYVLPKDIPSPIEKIIEDIISSAIVKQLKTVRNSDYISDLLVKKDKDTVMRFNEYIESSMEELRLLQNDGEISGINPLPDVFLFGHTHVPVDANDNKSYAYKNKSIKLLNSGGWLGVQGKLPVATGGEVFMYETGSGFTAKRISVQK